MKMNVLDLQCKLKEILDVKEVTYDNVSIDDFIKLFISENDIKEPMTVSLELVETKKLILGDIYYTWYNRYDELKVYRTSYTNLVPFDFPISQPSFAKHSMPLIPQLTINDKKVNIPNEVLDSFPFNWNDEIQGIDTSYTIYFREFNPS